jgi:hypothetical protein
LANKIDKGLKEKRESIFEAIQAGKYKNVGVLPFKVHIGESDPSFHFGQLNRLMAARVGNMLILGLNPGLDPKSPIGVIPDAGDQAGKVDPKASWQTEAGRVELFKRRYLRPWKQEGQPDKVQVEAFLTGEVRTTKDFKKTTVIVQIFDKSKPKELRTLAQFEATTERSTLADMDMPFKIERRSLKGLKNSDLQNIAEENASQSYVALPQGVPPSPPPLPHFDEYIDFKVFYDGKLAQVDGGKLAPPASTIQKVHFEIKSKVGRVAVAVLVNGKNTLGMETGRDPERYSRWVLEPDKTYGIAGFYGEKNKLVYFGIKPAAEVPKSDFVEAELFKIRIHVFAEAAGAAKPEAASDLDFRTSFSSQAPSLKDFRDNLLATAKFERRNLICPGKDGKANIEEAKFEGPYVSFGVLSYAPVGQ